MNGNLNIREYILPLLRWWWLVAAATTIAAVASIVYVAIQPPTFNSRATVLVGTTLRDPNPNGSEFYLAQQLADIYADIANRGPIRSAVMTELGLSWLPGYLVGRIPNSQIIEVNVWDSDPERAFRVAQALVDQLILLGPTGQERRDREEFVAKQLATLEISIPETEDAIVARENELIGIRSARELAQTQGEITALQNKLTRLRDTYTSLLATTQRGASNVLQVLEPAVLPTQPMSSDLLLNVMAAAAIGFTLAAGGAYLIEFLDKSFHDAEQVRRVLDVTLLGTLPRISPNALGSEQKLIVEQGLPSSTMEAYRMLRINLQFASVDRPLQRLLVTSAEPQDGKSLTAANIAIAIARFGKRVILVDADLHRPTMHKLFALYNNVGVTSALLANQSKLEQVIQPTMVENLSVLTSGPLPPNPAELLGSKRMLDLLANLNELCDIVVIDSPPLSAVVDAVVLATESDGVLLVLRAKKTTRDTAKRSLAMLEQVRANMLGIVLNDVEARTSGHYSSDYGYYNAAYGVDVLYKRQTLRNGLGDKKERAETPAADADIPEPKSSTTHYEWQGSQPTAPLPEDAVAAQPNPNVDESKGRSPHYRSNPLLGKQRNGLSRPPFS